ncbi:hypothetical protein [Aneurinibacillus aneurinilyticus]|jgi:hypothetical protein|uniref:hypothetical protein n=1 Tax=Aneurinibacillus aneurinilyticus TaxID=1391 RepID=UPI0023F7249E|nr:hypothetical protein [Aneurinibacillus aneurinilyticus]MCI1695607.1 hypothetical protein [Aneurinibacillus aneurinilyticus]
MSYDLEVLVVNQANPVSIPFLKSIEVLNEIDDNIVMRFKGTWKLMSQTKGVWYSLVKEDDGIKNAFLLCDSDFEIETKELPIPYWIDNEDVIYNLTPLIIRKEFMDEFETTLEFLVKQSPCNTLMFLPRYQGGDYEIIQGTISLNNFIKHLKNNKILFNVCYVITNG